MDYFNDDFYKLDQIVDPTDQIELVDERLTRTQLMGALRKLKTEVRNALILRYGLFDDRVYTQREISEILGVDEHWVKRLISDGLQELRLFLDPDEAAHQARLEFVKMLFDKNYTLEEFADVA